MKQCPALELKDGFATLRRFDVVDIAESDNPDQGTKAAMIVEPKEEVGPHTNSLSKE